MLPTYSSVAILLAIVGMSMSSGLHDGLYECPDDKKAQILVGQVDKDVPATIGYVTLTIRIPESGLLDNPISCVIATDLETDGTGGTVVQTGGGLGSKFVQLKITSKLFGSLKYRVEVYTDKPASTTANTLE